MSFTTTLETNTTVTPSARLSPRPAPSSSSPTSKATTAYHTPAELYSWTFKKDAIAPCFIKDVYDLKEDPELNQDFFWLGHAPCRVVTVVGLVVGLQQLDYQTRYTVDDGTAVIDCVHRHVQRPSTSRHPNLKNKARQKAEPELTTKSAPIPTPVASIGSSVRVHGRVSRSRGSRSLNVDGGNLELCSSMNEEHEHWMKVLDLHRRLYSLSGPFVIPLTSSPDTLPEPFTSSSTAPFASPTSSVTVAASSVASSPVKSPTQCKSPPRLRHPSRLHSRDLTDNTFRIYLKHYMDNAPSYRPRRQQSQACKTTSTTTSSDTEDDEYDATPRASNANKRLKEREGIRRAKELGLQPQLETDDYGFTLSYLRRVPELAEMARRVVRAERKRREREARAQSSDKAKSNGMSEASTASAARTGNKSPETTAKKMKRLFVKAIRDLYAEGSIVLWDGPVRDCIDVSADQNSSSQVVGGCSNRLWKSSVNTSASITSTSMGTMSTINGDADSGGDLSDAISDEEAYLPVTTQRVAMLIEEAITALNSRRAAKSLKTNHIEPHTPVKPKPSTPPTTQDILAYLRRRDQRWANLGEWLVDEALEELQRDERVYRAGGGRWALCL